MSVSRYKQLKRALRSAVLRALAFALSFLPLRVAVALGAVLGRVAWPLSPKLRRDMRASLAVAFPERTAEERDAIARESLVHLGMVAGEVVTMRRWRARMDEYADAAPETVALAERARARGKGIILVMGHVGNWELTSRLARYVQPCAAIAKRSWHAKIDEMAERFRGDGGVATLWREDVATGRAMLRLLKGGGCLGILIDQDTDVQSVFVPFFGRLAATPRAAGDLALRFGATVLVVTSHRRGPRIGDGHRLELVEVPYDPEAVDREAEAVRITAACAAIQEQAIRRHPAEWVWMHQRWKTRPEERATAAGAQRSA
jgi:KDO2-lipid IV(A) lauroyltransferase